MPPTTSDAASSGAPIGATNDPLALVDYVNPSQADQLDQVGELKASSEARHEQLKRIFSIFDIDLGHIDGQDLARVMTWLGLSHTKKEVEEMMQLDDEDHDGVVSFAEFERLLERTMAPGVEVTSVLEERARRGACLDACVHASTRPLAAEGPPLMRHERPPLTYRVFLCSCRPVCSRAARPAVRAGTGSCSSTKESR